MSKILIIGQAPPAVEQEVPYDTTQLYEWLDEVGISKDKAKEMFEFEAVGGIFPGFSKSGHSKPTKEDMEKHWEEVLKEKVRNADKIWVMGAVADEFLEEKSYLIKENAQMIWTIHPSKRNRSLYNKSKVSILNDIKELINN